MGGYTRAYSRTKELIMNEDIDKIVSMLVSPDPRTVVMGCELAESQELNTYDIIYKFIEKMVDIYIETIGVYNMNAVTIFMMYELGDTDHDQIYLQELYIDVLNDSIFIKETYKDSEDHEATYESTEYIIFFPGYKIVYDIDSVYASDPLYQRILNNIKNHAYEKVAGRDTYLSTDSQATPWAESTDTERKRVVGCDKAGGISNAGLQMCLLWRP